jgi:RimJ/RimL family protein N-acetyltransferase
MRCQRKGAEIIAVIIAFAQEQYQPKTLRATIAVWNLRAQKATTKNGFHNESRFNSCNPTLCVLRV